MKGKASKGPKCRKAVILAAGGGTRISSLSTGRPKCLMELGGKPIVEWVLAAIAEAGMEEAVIVTGFKADVLRQALGPASRLGLTLTYVHNRRWRRPNGLSLYAARAEVKPDEAFLALMSDHLLPAGIIKKVAEARTSKCVLAVDTDTASVFDIHDATKVRVVDGRPAAIGKKLRSYNAVDCGLFRFDGRIFGALETAFRAGRESLTDGVRILIAHNDLDVLSADAMFWIDIDTPRAYRQALRVLEGTASTSKRKRK
jgi:1L-myo-inositol 1-phosphate cytidylyltransferase